MEPTTIKILKIEDLDGIVMLTKQLNSNLSVSELKKRQQNMFEFPNYRCFGLFIENKLIGVSSGWITVRLYSDKQLELDNVIVDTTLHSKGYGKVFLERINSWAVREDCKTIELNTYVQNERSHKFYFNQGYQILGFHFQKRII